MKNCPSTAFELQRSQPAGDVERLVYLEQKQVLSVKKVLQLLHNNQAFRKFFSQSMANSTFSAFRWETPAIRRQSLENSFECVLVDCRSLERAPDPDSFASFFNGTTDRDVVDFTNLGGDAHLIAPCPPINRRYDSHVHLASFLRYGQQRQIDNLWQRCSQLVLTSIGDKPLWLNTAGDGVAWLHLRIDQQPKYYWYRPYKRG